MAFVMVSMGSLSQSGVHTVSLRRVGLALSLVAAMLLGCGIAAGYLVGRGGELPRVLPSIPRANPNPYTVEQLGTLSGRLFKLESEAAQLGRKIGVITDYESQLKQRKGGTGGPMLPPRLGADPVAALDAALQEVEAHLTEVGHATTQRNLQHMSFPSRLPVIGAELGSVFGNRLDPINHRLAFHAGLDFAAESGSAVFAAAGGKVVFAAYHPEFGNLVEIDHGNGLTTRYAHNRKLLVKEGTIVTPGQQVGEVGTTGRSTGPHLHFEVLRDGQYVDPQLYLSGL